MGNETDDFFNAVNRFDSSEDYNGLVNYVAGDKKDINIAIHAVYRLMQENKIKAAYVISKMFHNAGVQHPILQFALAIGGLTTNNAEDEEIGISVLSAITTALPVDKQALLYNQVIAAPLFRLTEGALIAGDDTRLMRILDILKAGSPRFRQIFEEPCQKPLNLNMMRERGRERAKLIDFALPPAGAPRPPRRVVVAVRNLFFPQNANSRLFDIGPRLTAAMNAYGWQTTFIPMKWANLAAEFQEVANVCEQEQADLLIFDDHVIEHHGSHGMRTSMIAQLRANLPALKIVALHLDAWVIDPSLMLHAGTSADAIWTFAPSLAIWDHPALANRAMQIPMPLGGSPGLPDAPLPSQMIFTGAIKGYNWHRVFWRVATMQADLPIEWSLSHHMADNLSALDSFTAYMRRLGATGCSLNMSMRPNLEYALTGRCFETLLSGALLVQEVCPDLDRYFIAGEHYLEFTTFAELQAMGEFLIANPSTAESIRRAGNEFARAHYSDDKIIGYLDKHLFYPTP